MTNSEFRAWFDGFTEAMDSTPNTKQWERIKARVKEIDGAAVTEHVFVDRYWPTWTWTTYPVGSVVGTPMWTCNQQNPNLRDDARTETVGIYFNSSDAMLALGRNDYLSA